MACKPAPAGPNQPVVKSAKEMKLTVERAALLASLGHVQSVVERRNTIPILSNVQLATEDSQLSLTATDLDLAVVTTLAAEVGQGGATTTPAHTLYDIVRKLPDGAQVELSHGEHEGQLALKAGRSEFFLPCLPKEDFPVVAEDELPVTFSIDAAALRRLIEKSRFAISTEEARYYLNGIFVHAVEESGVALLRAVATDGHRLSRVDTPLPDGAADMPGVIVPRKAVTEIAKLIEHSDGAVEIALSDTKIRFVLSETVLTTKLIDGTFPDYGRVIPAENDKTMEVDGKSLTDAVDRVSTISTEKSRAVKLALEPAKLVLSSTSSDNASASEELSVAYDGEPMEIGFNSRYLLDVTSQIEGNSVRLNLADSVSPTIIEDTGDASVLYVLMPMRV